MGTKQLEWHLIAIELAEKSTDSRTRQWLGPLYNTIGWAYHDMGDYQNALKLNHLHRLVERSD